MKDLTDKVKSEVTRDWNAIFSSLGVYEPLHLLRRVGPLLMGVLLERDSSNRTYRPTFHVHNLGVEASSISLILCEPLRTEKGVGETIAIKDHANRFTDAAQRLSNQVALPFAGELTTAQVIEAYRRYQARGGLYAMDDALFTDMALIYTWVGQKAKAEAIVQEGRMTMGKWPKTVLDRIGGVDAWAANVSAMVADPEKLRERVQQQLAFLHAQDLPASQLLA